MGAKTDGLSDAICPANQPPTLAPETEATVTQILGISLRQRSSPPDMQAMCTHSSSQLNTLYWQAWWTIITSPPIHTHTNTQLTRPVCEAAIMESIVPLYFLPTLSATEHNNASVQSKTICLHYSRDESSSFEGYLSKYCTTKAQPFCWRKTGLLNGCILEGNCFSITELKWASQGQNNKLCSSRDAAPFIWLHFKWMRGRMTDTKESAAVWIWERILKVWWNLRGSVVRY